MAPLTLENVRMVRVVVKALTTTQTVQSILAIGKMTIDMVKVSTHKLILG